MGCQKIFYVAEEILLSEILLETNNMIKKKENKGFNKVHIKYQKIYIFNIL